MSSGEGLLGLFPPGAHMGDGGHLVVGGCDVVGLAEEFGTPAYVVDEGALRSRIDEYRRALAERWPGPNLVVFASKAFPCVPIERIMADEGIGCDVASRGELALALRAGFDPARIVVHGNAKSDRDIHAALEAGVGWIVIDNDDDIDRLERLAERPQRVLLRVIPGVDAPTHAAIATGGHDSKFGMSIAAAQAAIARIETIDDLVLDGLHVHIGSQILAVEPFRRAVEAVAGLGEFRVYDLGGGLGARYSFADEPPSVGDYLDVLVGEARRRLPGDATLLLEPGRSLVARAGITLYEVQTVKRSRRTFVAVDGGMGDNLEVSLFGQRFEAMIADRVDGRVERCQLVGHHCESGDRLIDGVDLVAPRVGDVVAVPVTGAYCFTMANNYNASLRPPVVIVNDGVARLAVRRETFDDLIARDIPVADHSTGAP
jgi:diaminopimelate decarboxylase